MKNLYHLSVSVSSILRKILQQPGCTINPAGRERCSVSRTEATVTAIAAPPADKTAPPAAAPVYSAIADMILPETLVLHARPQRPVSEDEYFAFCRENDHLRVECRADGEWIIMPPTAGDTSDRNAELTMQLRIWAKRDGTGVAFDSNGGFTLPNGARRAPDASWVTRARLSTLTPEEKQKFLPLCPDFAVELRSRSDSLTTIQAKMNEYLACGARLGLLLDPTDRTVHVYRPGQAAPTVLNDPESVSCDPELPGFVLDARSIFDTSF